MLYTLKEPKANHKSILKLKSDNILKKLKGIIDQESKLKKKVKKGDNIKIIG